MEYSASLFLLQFLTELVALLSMAAMTAVLFLGGWLSPLPFPPFTWIPGVIWFLIKLWSVVFCYSMVVLVKARFGYDDSLDAFGVHGAGGTLGAILTGVFAVAAVNPVFHDAAGKVLPVGLLEGNGQQLLHQFAGVGIAFALAGGGSVILLKVTDALVGLRVTADQEAEGLDMSQHGEVGYDFES